MPRPQAAALFGRDGTQPAHRGDLGGGDDDTSLPAPVSEPGDLAHEVLLRAPVLPRLVHVRVEEHDAHRVHRVAATDEQPVTVCIDDDGDAVQLALVLVEGAHTASGPARGA